MRAQGRLEADKKLRLASGDLLLHDLNENELRKERLRAKRLKKQHNDEKRTARDAYVKVT